MTEGKKIGQWLVGIVLLFLFLVTAFIPWITLSGDDYVDAAVNVHEYAREHDAVGRCSRCIYIYFKLSKG